MPDYTPIYKLPYLSDADMLKETPSIDENFATAVEDELWLLNDRIDALGEGGGGVGGGVFEGVHGEYGVSPHSHAPGYRYLHIDYNSSDLSLPGSVKVSEQDYHNYSKGWVQDYSPIKAGDEMRVYMSEESGRWFKWRITSDAVYHANDGGVPYYSWFVDRGEVFNSTNQVIVTNSYGHMFAGSNVPASGGDGGDGGDGGTIYPPGSDNLVPLEPYSYRLSRKSTNAAGYLHIPFDYTWDPVKFASRLGPCKINVAAQNWDKDFDNVNDFSPLQKDDYIHITTPDNADPNEDISRVIRFRITNIPWFVQWSASLGWPEGYGHWQFDVEDGVILDGPPFNDTSNTFSMDSLRFSRTP